MCIRDRVEVSFEQMYVPYQPPFTIGQTERYLQRVYEANGNPAYVTLDTGHMIGQAKYQKPTREQLVESFGKERPGIWQAVSYTHLDVYKRQEYMSVVIFIRAVCIL